MNDKDLISRRRVLAKKKTMYGWSSGAEEVVSVEYIESIPPVEQPMSAVEYLKAEQRMCFDENVGKRNCLTCPLSSRINPVRINCSDYSRQHPEEAVAIVEAWAKKHSEERGEKDNEQ